MARDARCVLEAAKTKLGNTAERLRSENLHALASQGRTLLSLEVRLGDIVPAALERASQSVERARLLVVAHDPLAILQRGYSVTLDASGKPIKDAAAVQPGDRTVTLLADGRFTSTVDDVSPSASHD
jgi:exodeoxyribonuclease VII large subunit